MTSPFPGWTIGVCAVGKVDDKPPLPAKRPDLCADLDHPGCTYNPIQGKTWCLCGDVIYDGDQAVQCLSCCGGPLSGDPDLAWTWPVTSTSSRPASALDLPEAS